MGLTDEQVQIIKATVPVLQQHGTKITTVFYENMLRERPELNAIFNTTNQANGHQAHALAGSLYAYASNIDNLEALAPAVKLITNKHASLNIQPEQYSIVGHYLIAAMAQVLGDACTPAIADAWGAAYWQLANLMIEEEAKLYDQTEGWAGWREFRIAKKVVESDEITSFYLEPVDKKSLPSYKPGQYISVRVDVPRLKHPQPRQYSLSDTPKKNCYRISVKREDGLNPKAPGSEAHPGYVSNVLHETKNEGDIIEVTHPFGDFFLENEKATHPVVLISAGVGITPLSSILNTLVASNLKRDIHFIHGARRGTSRPFKKHLQSLDKAHPSLKVTFFTSSPAAHEKQGLDYHRAGRIDLSTVSADDLFLNNAKTEYYICGPEGFMNQMLKGLEKRGVKPEQVKMELFGTGGIPKDVEEEKKSNLQTNEAGAGVAVSNASVVAVFRQSALFAASAGAGMLMHRRFHEQLSWPSFGLLSVAFGTVAAVAMSPLSS